MVKRLDIPELSSEEWLSQRYVIEELGLKDIGQILGCNRSTVGRALTRLGIQRRNYMTERERARRSDSRPDIKGENNPRYGKPISDETREKISAALKGTRSGKDHPWYGRHHTEETKKKLSIAKSGEKHHMYGKHHTEETKEKMSRSKIGEKHPWYGRKHSEESKKKMSESRTGEKNHQWRGGISYDPYCFKFTDRLKEEVRDRFNRLCVMCSKTEEENGRKLDVHHIDFNKNQGCDDVDWKLVPLCQSCHGWTTSNRDLSQEVIEPRFARSR